MVTLHGITLERYLLPEDGQAAQQRFLGLINSDNETYISAYAFDFAPMVDAIEKADAAGVCFHILIDHLQALGPHEHPEIVALAAKLQNSDLTITSAAFGPRTSEINHTKAVVDCAPGGCVCLEGSVNFSASGWNQANTMEVYVSDEAGQEFITRLKAHRDWARANHPDWQIQHLAG